MHELSIAMSLIETICDELPRLGDPKIHAVHLRVGALSGVVADALTFAFDVAAEDSPVAGARLAIETSAGTELQLVALEVIEERVDDADCGSSPESSEEERSRRRVAS